jgi:hypothetical protein
MTITKRTHYNPCFWTALWNHEYYESFMGGKAGSLVPRKQTTFVLNVKSNKIYKDKVDNVHYEMNLGIAKYKSKMLDFENIFTRLENTPSYQVLPQIIKRQNIGSAKEKVSLADFIYLQRLRSHAILGAIIEFNEKQSIKKFQSLIYLKKMLSDQQFSFRTVKGISQCKWILYRTKKDTFPLSDSAILMDNKSIMVALSPRLMLEILNGTNLGIDLWSVRDSPAVNKIDEFRRRTIKNTFREIIFTEESLLEEWQKTPEFTKRVEIIAKTKGNYSLIYQKREKELQRIRDRYNSRQAG